MTAIKTAEAKPLPPFVVLSIVFTGGSRSELNFVADCVADRQVLKLSGVAAWRGEAAEDWFCVIDLQSREKISQAAKHGANVSALIRSCEEQIGDLMLHEDPFRPERVCGMWLSLEDVAVVGGRVMAVWSLETPNGGNVVCSLPLLDEVGRQYDRDGMSRTLQWILRCDDSLEGLLPRLLASAEKEGQRLLDEHRRNLTSETIAFH